MNPILDQLEDELARPLRGLTSTQTLLRSQPDPSRWSIWQIAQHLLLTYSSTSASLEDRLKKGVPTRSRITFQQTAAQLCVLRFGLLPGRREAPPFVAPPECPPDLLLTGDELASAASTGLDRMDTLLNKAEARFGTSPCNSHYILGPLSVPQWRRFHLVHGRH
ncbi:MAG TPA: DinB family protein, partial [Edaphobacter sp.]|nr:DinB family protein [Edaphobacter sp.]